MDPDPGTGAILTPGSGIRDKFSGFPGLRYWILDLTHIAEKLEFYVMMTRIFFRYLLNKFNNFEFCEKYGYKKGKTT